MQGQVGGATWRNGKGVDAQAAELLHHGARTEQVDIDSAQGRTGLQQHLELARLQLQLLHLQRTVSSHCPACIQGGKTRRRLVLTQMQM